MSQHANSSSSGDRRLTHSVKSPSSYNHSKRVHTNHANKGSKSHEDVIDEWYQRVLELEEKEHKMRKIKEFYCRNPDAPMPMPNIDASILPIKNMLERRLPKISFQSGASNNNNNNPSPKMQDNDNNRTKIASQKTGGDDRRGAFPRNNRHSHPRSIQPVPMNYGSRIVKMDDVDDRGFKVTMTLKYNCLGDIMDAWVTDGLYEYLSERERRREKRLQEYLSS